MECIFWRNIYFIRHILDAEIYIFRQHSQPRHKIGQSMYGPYLLHSFNFGTNSPKMCLHPLPVESAKSSTHQFLCRHWCCLRLNLDSKIQNYKKRIYRILLRLYKLEWRLNKEYSKNSKSYSLLIVDDYDVHSELLVTIQLEVVFIVRPNTGKGLVMMKMIV